MYRRDFLKAGTAIGALTKSSANPQPNPSSGPPFGALEPLPLAGIEIGGILARQIREDAIRGWVKTTNEMSHRGIIQWDANSHLIVSYFLPFQKAYYSAPETWNSSVPYYQRLIDKTGSYGGGEFEGHWMDMLCRMAWIGRVDEYRDLAHRAVADVLSSRDESGYIGVNPSHLRFTDFRSQSGLGSNGDEDGVGSVWTALLSYYRFTGDQKALDAVTRSVDLYLDRMKGKNVGFPVLNTSPIAKLYLYSRNKQHLDRARAMVEAGLKSLPGGPFFFEKEFGLNHMHSATAGMLLLAMADLYRACGDTELLHKAKLLNDQVVKHAVQAHGAPTGHQEALAERGPRVNTEGCDVMWWSWFWMEMLALTGDGSYGDLVETAVWNALPGHRGKDGTAWAYFSRPNQLFATRGGMCGTVYAARILVECCLGNLGRTLPIMAERMVLQSRDGDFAVAFYGSGRYRGPSARAGNVEIIQDTDYPFADDIGITVKPDRSGSTFAVRLRIPAWCKSPRLRVNGADYPLDVRNCWTSVQRNWGAADVLELTLPQQTEVNLDAFGQAIVRRGPLVYALAVEGERRQTDEWGSFEVLVTPESKWNYALLLDRRAPADSIRFRRVSTPADGSVWQHSPYTLEADAVRIPDWRFAGGIAAATPRFAHDIPEPQLPPAPFKTGTPERIVLVPYGFAHLRMTHLPVVWKT